MHNFISQSLNLGYAQIQILLKASPRFPTVGISAMACA